MAVREIVTREPGRQVGTVGHIEVSPNAPNVIPGLVRLSIELRDLSSAEARRDEATISARGRARLPPIRETTIEIRSQHDEHGAGGRDADVQRAIEAAAAGAGARRRCVCRAAPATTRR